MCKQCRPILSTFTEFCEKLNIAILGCWIILSLGREQNVRKKHAQTGTTSPHKNYLSRVTEIYYKRALFVVAIRTTTLIKDLEPSLHPHSHTYSVLIGQHLEIVPVLPTNSTHVMIDRNPYLVTCKLIDCLKWFPLKWHSIWKHTTSCDKGVFSFICIFHFL